MSPVGAFFKPFPPKTGTNMLHPRPPPIVELVVDAMYWFRFLLPCSSPGHQKSASADDKSKPNKPSPSSPEPTSDSGSVHGSQRQQLWLSLHRSHRVRFCVSSVFCFSPKERSGAIDLSRRIKIFVTAAI